MIPENNSEKIKVLFITTALPTKKGDISGIYVLDYIKSLLSIANVSILHLDIYGSGERIVSRNGFVKYYLSLNAKKHYFFLLKFYSYLKIYLRFFAFIKKISVPEVIHAHDPYFAGLCAYYLSKKFRIPYVITVHDTKFKQHQLKKILAGIILQNAIRVLSVSKWQASNITSIFPAVQLKIIVTYNPVDVGLFKIKAINKSQNILFAGRLVQRKGALRTLLAFQLLAKDLDDWFLTFIGSGPEAEMINNLLGRDDRLKSRILIKGRLTKDQMSYEMNKATFFVFPTLSETFGIIIAEAMACGLPVIVGNRTAPKEFVDSDSGVLVDPENVDEIAKAIKYMADKYKTYIPEKIRDKVVTRFSFENFGAKLINIYKEVTS